MRPLNIGKDDLVEVVFLGSERDVRPYWTVVLTYLASKNWWTSSHSKEYWLERFNRRYSR